jgi:hypothetical protein
VVELVLAYYVALRSLLRTRPELRRCLTRCRHCRIYFFTHPRNARRSDLRCPFGCREAHRQRESNRRSTAYYQDAPGKEKKRQQNAKRRSPRSADARPTAPPVEPPLPWPRPIVAYVRLLTSLIEGRAVRWAEVVELLTRVLRQHRMVRTRRIAQIMAQLHEQPP